MTASHPSRFRQTLRHAASLLLVLCLVVAPAIGWTPSRLSAKTEAGAAPSPAPSCCKAEKATPASSSTCTKPAPTKHSTDCKDCAAGFCICVGGVYVIDPPLALTHATTPRPLLVSAQLSIPESSSLEDIFHPPRA